MKILSLKSYLLLASIFFLILCQNKSDQGTLSPPEVTSDKGPYQATGIKIGEVTQTSAIVWTRHTKNPRRVGSEAAMPEVLYQDPETGEWKPRQGRQDRLVRVNYPYGYDVTNIEGAVPGVAGEVQVLYRSKDGEKWSATK